MKRSLSILIILFVTAILSGCILSKTPSTNDVTMTLGEQKTFSVNVFPTGGTCTWTLDETLLSNTGNSYVYTAQAGDHTLVVKAKHLLGTDTQTWNIICESTGLAIPATSYADASNITLFLDSGTGKGYLKVDDGAKLEPGTKANFGIRVEGGTFPVDKVLVGNGGGYQISAYYNEDLNLYLCNYFVSDTDRIIPVLIEAVHPNGQASKAKYVFRTVNFATSSQLIRKGLGVLVGKDIVQSAKGMKLNGLSVDNLIPFAGANDTYIMKLTSGIFSIPFNFIDGLTGNEGIDEEVAPTLKMKTFGIFNTNMGIKSMLLDEMLGGMAGGFGADMSGLNLAAKPLYLDINGIPASTTTNMTALSLGLFMSQDADPTIFPAGVTLYNNSDLNPAIDFTKSADDPSAIEISLSQANMSQFVGEMLNGSVVVGALAIPAAVPNYAGVTPAVDQEMRISIKKDGVIFDFKTDAPLIIINDLRIEYLENKVPKWMMSLDLAFKLDASSHQAINPDTMINESFLDIYLSLVPEYSHCAVLKDDMGITMFDKSAFVDLIVSELKEMLPSDNPQKGELLLSIGTDSFGLTLSGAYAVSDAGRCFLSMTTETADLSKAGICFINTATF